VHIGAIWEICPINHIIVGRICLLVGGLEYEFYDFPYLIIIPTDELIFFRGVGIPPTSL